MTPLERALALARGGQGALQVHRQRINDLNVYPVPDGDTGSNLTDTVTRLTQGLEQLPPDADRPTIAHAATRTVLMGARGNSGVILSQIVRGFAEALGAGEGPVDAGTVARALRAASDAAYGAVRQPVEGTMLTAIRAMAERAEAEPADATLDDLLASVLEAGDDAVARTQEMLPVLRQARVVDAGAAGLVEYVRGAVAGMQRRMPAAVGALAAAPPPSLDSIHLQPSRYRYCTSFLVEDEGVDRELLESLLEPLGDSLLVVGEPPILKVHLHTDDPGAAISLGVGAGAVADVEVADMTIQVRDRTLRLLEGPAAAQAACGLVAVADGDGVVAAYRAAASAVELVAGGQSANPSAGEIADAIAASAAEGVLVLPNNRNVVLAAENAAALAGRPAAVVPTLSPAAGLVLAGRFDPGRALAENAVALAQLNGTLRCGEVAAAVRDAQMDGVAVTAGQYLALVEGRLQSSHDDAASAAAAVLRDLAQGAAELTVLTAAEAGLRDAIDELAARRRRAGCAHGRGRGSGVSAVRVRHARSRAADGRDHRDRARFDGRPGRSRQPPRQLVDGAADRQLRRRDLPRLRRHRRRRVLPAAARGTTAAPHRSAVAGRLAAGLRGARRLPAGAGAAGLEPPVGQLPDRRDRRPRGRPRWHPDHRARDRVGLAGHAGAGGGAAAQARPGPA